MKMPVIYIIIINYNGYADTIECINSLKNIEYDNFKIILIDNASTDNSVLNFNDLPENCTLIEQKENLGFSGGNNVGIKYAIQKGAEYILLLNNDTIVESDFLNNMLESFENSNVGIVGCKIMYFSEQNRIWFAGGKINWIKFIGKHFGIKELDDGTYDREGQIEFMTGCCMLIKTDLIREIGLLPEEYFMYYEDVEYCLRTNDAGYKIWYNPKAKIYHKVGISGGGEGSAFSIRWITRNRLIFMKRYRHKVNNIMFYFSILYFIMTSSIRVIQYIIHNERDKSFAIINGFRDALKLKKDKAIKF